MDLVGALRDCMPQLVALAEEDDEDAATRTPRATLEKWDQVLTNDIAVNFDSKFFYLQLPQPGPASEAAAAARREVPSGPLRVQLDERCPLALLRAVRFLIVYDQMNQQIKNASYRIHFRDYVRSVDLEDERDEVRISVVLALCERLGYACVLDFLLERETTLRSQIAKSAQQSTSRRASTNERLLLARYTHAARAVARAVARVATRP